MQRCRWTFLVAQVHTPRGTPLYRVAPRPAPDSWLHAIRSAHFLTLSAFRVFPLVVPRARGGVRTISIGGRDVTEPLIVCCAAREYRGCWRLDRGCYGGLKVACFQARQQEV